MIFLFSVVVIIIFCCFFLGNKGRKFNLFKGVRGDYIWIIGRLVGISGWCVCFLFFYKEMKYIIEYWGEC